MIQVQDINDKMLSSLDAEGSDRYLFDQDIKPAVNQSIDWLMAVFARAFETTKLSAENLRELLKVRIWQANSFSRVEIDEAELGHEVWSLVLIAPEPEVYPVTSPPALPNDYQSIFFPTLSYTKSKYNAKNLSLEQWNENADNIFEAGNDTITGSLKSYAYLSQVDYASTGTYSESNQIEIRPSIAGEFVAVGYIKKPSQISLIYR